MGVVTDAVSDAASVAMKANPITGIFTNIKLYLTIFVIGVSVAGFFGVRWYLGHEQAKIDALNQKLAAQQIAITQQAQAQALMQSDLAQLKLLTDDYNKQIAQIRMNSNHVTTMFNSQQYQNLVKSQPTQAESQINTDVNQLFQDVNDASRKPAQ
jgi:hypothetical protein